jgi:hypothetical protein
MGTFKFSYGAGRVGALGKAAQGKSGVSGTYEVFMLDGLYFGYELQGGMEGHGNYLRPRRGASGL